MLAVFDAAHLLTSGARQDAHAVVEDAVHRLPVLVALQRRLGPGIVEAPVLQVPIIAEDQVVVAQLVLHGGGVDAGLAARVGEHDDERVFVGMLQRRPEDEREGGHTALGTAAETDDFEAPLVVVLERARHLIEEL
jgi:hypothetical protein